jgi:hypothetical protein
MSCGSRATQAKPGSANILFRAMILEPPFFADDLPQVRHKCADTIMVSGRSDGLLETRPACWCANLERLKPFAAPLHHPMTTVVFGLSGKPGPVTRETTGERAGKFGY